MKTFILNALCVTVLNQKTKVVVNKTKELQEPEALGSWCLQTDKKSPFN